MFRWYRKSTVCLALLSDVDKSDFVSDQELQSHVPSSCRWFTRGWTLQELLAPDKLLFFDVNWIELGSRSKWARHISKATGIDVRFLLGIERDPFESWDLEAVLRDTSVATKMSWAAGRQTTRVEDQAYCLLGLFDIHMPMLYGEGRKALRLLEYPHYPNCAYTDVTTGPRGGLLVGSQLSRDISGHNAGGRPRSLLATSPRDFRFAGSLEPCGIPGHKRPAFAMSQRGLEISLPIFKDESHHHIVYGLLACSPKVKTGGSYLVAVPSIRLSVIDVASAGHDDDMYFTLLRDSCPDNSKSGAPFHICPGEANLNNSDWWSYHLTRPSPPSRVLSGAAHPWDKIILKRVQYAPDTTIAAAVLNLDLYPLHPNRPSQRRILLVVSTDLSCRVRKLAFGKEVNLRTLMTIASQPDLVGPKLESERREVKEFRSGKETRIVYKLLDGIELCLRTWC
ncbi:hypothetical protein NEUTE1DRAFT_47420 [Neurospora tetrasperma FGSC 2508]|uniref:Heterokaryon incompatibility domain-containing protein n=1 Tax=Neurospora tetrasperma (strain FGSC 2508 / ATCC MYA-4615 / P0657) TaxID=510951 RepID=F8MS56_NEUT8|nr:uncharacterized protein NEUTE1DRAFT_47420 [Neurospora tetrasperma FGSC 2508]EGO55850.1 hypothetical protein NEUTE1DRAFT_47420 [Neurospora tetrasperma FGSC 2508]EGZ68893.1 hypothetical protein NEUTE2DRAFT_71521 [Neurospora tetrasperma FGSC 2509]